jgi:hypothetical protein
VPESPLAKTPYEVLGVLSTVSDDELRKAYRKRLRETHPDAGGSATDFHAVQHAWELIGTVELRSSYDARGISNRVWTIEEQAPGWAPTPPKPRSDSRPQARTHGHPGGWYRERYLTLVREWAGRGVDITDPYDPALVRNAPREIRHLLAAAVAEEESFRQLSKLGIGFTMWHDVATGVPGNDIRHDGGKLDHIVLGPSGLWGLLSEDWGEPVKLKRGELIGPTLEPGERPVHDLAARTKGFARSARVKFSAVGIVIPDDDSPEGVMSLGKVAGAHAVLVQRSRLINLIRDGLPGVGIGGTDLFDLRARLDAAVRFA